jgi:hypothetical protein
LRIGISPEEMMRREFIIIPTTHLHMGGFTLERDQNSEHERAELWEKRFASLLDMDLPFHKIGIAHLTCSTMAYWSRQTELEIYSKISDQDVYTLMKGAAETGVGIEINGCSMMYKEEEKEQILRFYRIARECGCKFYCGSDAHQPQELDRAIGYFNRAIEELGLQETDKFHMIK